MKRLNFPNQIYDHALFSMDRHDGEKYCVKISNITGEEVYSIEVQDQKSFRFDRGNLIGGIYFVQIFNNEKELIYSDTIIFN